MPDIFPNSPLDGTYIKDDFLSNSAVADGTIGELGWEIATITVATTYTYVASQNGILRATITGTNSGDGSVLHLEPDGIVLAGTNQVVRCRVRYPDITDNLVATNNFRIGFSDSITVTEPGVGIWIDSDAGVLSFDVASTNGDVSVAAANVSSLTSGTTMVLGTWHDLALHMSETNVNGGPKVIHFFVDGELAGTITDSLLGDAETMELSILHWQDASGGDSLEFDIDYLEAWLPRN